MMNDIELNIAMNVMAAPVSSTQLARWERKALEAASSSSSSSTSSNTPSSCSATPSKCSASRKPMTMSNNTSNGNGKHTPSHSRSSSSGDRFIPTRSAMNADVQLHQLQAAYANENADTNGSAGVSDPSASQFQAALAEQLFDVEDVKQSKILAFKAKAPRAPVASHEQSLRVLYTANRENPPVKKKFRHIASTPERVLDAPDMTNDYYLNLLDWSSSNLLAVGLGQSVYLWDATTGDIDLLMQTTEPDNIVTSVGWMADGNCLAIGTNTADVQLWDVTQKKQLRSMKGHQARISALAWNGAVLSSGSRDTNIINHDVRIQRHHTSTLSGHQQEICGLKWSPDGTQLASGGNDNLCCIWDATDASAPRYTLDQHTAAVKALAWCPWQRQLLATGAGTADRHIRFFNTGTGAMLNDIDAKSQVCALHWNPHDRELVSAHGYSQNQLTVWKYPSLARMADLTGHTARILHMAMSPDGTTVCSAAADETLRFWRVFDSPSASGSGAGATAAVKAKTLNAGALKRCETKLSMHIR